MSEDSRDTRPSSEPMRIMFGGGGTGGHIYPGLALADWIVEQRPATAIGFLATSRPIDCRIISPKQSSVTYLPTGPAPPPTRPWRWPGFLVRFYGALRMARKRIEQFCPDVVVGLGGFGSYPAVRAAQEEGIATVVLNPDLFAGRANRRLIGRASAVCCQFQETVDLVGYGADAHLTGCPVRLELFGCSREAAMRQLGLSPDKKTLLITGASLGARNINQAVVALLPLLAQYQGEWQTVHLTGSSDYEFVQKAYEKAGVGAVVEAFRDDMGLAYAAADLVLSRAGAGTVAELTALGLPAVLVPYPYHRDQHQVRQGEVLERGGAAVVVEDRMMPSANAAVLWPVLEGLFQDSVRLAAMAEASRILGWPDSAQRVGEIVLKLADASIEQRLAAVGFPR